MSGPMHPLVSVIVVNYNGKEFLQRCLTCLTDQSYSNLEILVVDNASVDGSVDFVRCHFPEVRVIVNQQNLGFAGGVNSALPYTRGKLIALVNPDTEADRDWVSNLVHSIQLDDNAAAATSVIVHRSGECSCMEQGRTLNILGYPVDGVFEDPSMAFYPSGCSMIIRRSVIEPIFDEDYFAYYEDALLGWKLRLKGYEVVKAHKAHINHYRGGIWDRYLDLKYFYNERNRWLTLLTCYSMASLLKVMPLLVLESIWRLLVNSAKSLVGCGLPVKPWLRAHWWLIRNWRNVRQKRKHVQSLREVTDNDVLKLMSCRIAVGRGSGTRIVNWLSRRYCKVIGLTTWELTR